MTAVKCSSQKLKQQQWEITSDVRPTSQQIKLADANKVGVRRPHLVIHSRVPRRTPSTPRFPRSA